jgi:hypothetical protein
LFFDGFFDEMLSTLTQITVKPQRHEPRQNGASGAKAFARHVGCAITPPSLEEGQSETLRPWLFLKMSGLYLLAEIVPLLLFLKLLSSTSNQNLQPRIKR